MAANKNTSCKDSVSEELVNCTSCLEVENVIMAIKYCVDCKTYVCQDCLNDHNKFAALRRHQIVEITEAAQLAGNTTDTSQGHSPVECGSHYGQYIDNYCTDHDEACCIVCVTIKHRSCKGITKIETVARGIKERSEFTDLESVLNQFIKYANQEKIDRNQNLSDMAEEKEQLLADVDKYEDRLIQKVKVLADASRENIRVTHAKHEDAVKIDVKELDSVISGMRNSLNQINKAGMNDVEAFIMKWKCQTTLKEVQKVVTDLSNNWKQTTLMYKFDDNIIPKKSTALGDVVEETKDSYIFNLKCKQSFDITCKTDTCKSKINGICQLANKTVVIMDANNKKLKCLTDYLEVKDYIDLNDTPECMCVTKPQEIAVLLEKKSLVQFVTIDEKISLEHKFPIKKGISTMIDFNPAENKLYVCSKREGFDYHLNRKSYLEVSVYNIIGECLSTYNGETEECFNFFEPLKILIGEDMFSVLDTNAGICTIRKNDMKPQPQSKELHSHSHSDYWNNHARFQYLCMLSSKMMLFFNSF